MALYPGPEHGSHKSWVTEGDHSLSLDVHARWTSAAGVDDVDHRPAVTLSGPPDMVTWRQLREREELL